MADGIFKAHSRKGGRTLVVNKPVEGDYEEDEGVEEDEEYDRESLHAECQLLIML